MSGDDDGLTVEELADEASVPLPDRQAMSTIHVPTGIDNFAMPINEATAVNQYTVQSYAIADASQVILLGQDDTTAP